MDAVPVSPAEQLNKEDPFKRNALLIINEMVELSPEHPTVLMDEVLHSIFFLGKINTPPFKPEEIVPDDDMLNVLKGLYPEPFNHYTTHLPQRSPISCVLDMIVSLKGQEHEDAVIKRLQELILKLKEDPTKQLVSSVICVSQDKTRSNSTRHYGVSMSTFGPHPGQIMVAASCLSTYWDRYVAHAVMTFYQGKKKKKRNYFDGTFELPQQVRCQAFSLTDRSQMPPCKSCGILFGLTSETKHNNSGWPYGNCAECESVSNLLKNEQGVRENVQPRQMSDTNRQRAEKDFAGELKNCLIQVQFARKGQYNYKPTFYVPQSVEF